MSSKTTNLNLTKPSEDEFYDINVQNENMDIIDREINGLKQPAYEVSTAMSDLNSGEMITVAFGKIAKAVSTLISHVANKSNPHGVTKNQIGLGNVPNVATNDQTPTYTEASSLSSLVSGEKTSVAFGKIAKAVSTLISHTTSKATNSVLGHVKLSDSTSSTSASTAGVAATPKAVKAAYDLANSNTEKLGTTDISGIGDGTVTGAIVNNKEAIEDVSQSLIDKSMNALFTVKTHGDLTTSGYYTLTSIPKNFGSNDIYVDQYGDIIFKKTGHYMLNISLVLDKNFASTLADISVHRYDSTGGSDTLISEHYFYAANNVHTGNVNILIPITAYGYLKIYCFGKVQGGYISLYRVE